jgi:capsular exopolysaccharide synthesis family protein
MELIWRALAKSRGKREQPVTRDARAREDRPTPHSATSQACLAHNVIVFTQTRVVAVPTEVLRQRRVVAALDDDPASGAYRVLRTAALQRLRAGGWSSLIVTSPTDGAGKTLTAVNLAVSLAREVNHTVLLADLDLRNPCVHTCFGQGEIPGIGDYLVDAKPLNEILFNPGMDRLVILPGRSAFSNSSEMLSSPQMVQLARELTTRYPSRTVIYDMPSVLAYDDVIAFAPHADAVLLVVEEGVTDREELRRAADALAGSNLIGTVLNKASAERSAYG